MDLSNKNLSIARAKKHVHKPGYKHTVEKRIEVVTSWLQLGNMRLVAELSGVSYALCREWKTQPWWNELVSEIRASRTTQVDNKLSKLVDRSLDLMEDRLENGDFVYNQKTGEVIRKPVTLRDINTVTKDVLTHQINIQKMEKEETVQQNQTTIQDQLKMLAMEFAKFNRKNTGPVEDAVLIGESSAVHDQWETRLPEGSGPLHEQASCEEEEGDAECSSEGDGEGWESEEGGWETSGPHQTPI